MPQDNKLQNESIKFDPKKHLILSMHNCQEFDTEPDKYGYRISRYALRYAINYTLNTQYANLNDHFLSTSMMVNGTPHQFYSDPGRLHSRTTGFVLNPEAIDVIYGEIKGGGR
jgi:hypothetical protein